MDDLSIEDVGPFTYAAVSDAQVRADKENQRRVERIEAAGLVRALQGYAVETGEPEPGKTTRSKTEQRR